jgi:hypothetical protein
LVPHHQPVRDRRFVEERCTERKCLTAKNSLRDCHEPRVLSHSRDGWKSHRMAHTRSAAWQFCPAQFLEQSINIFSPEHFGNYGEALRLNQFQPTQWLPPANAFEYFLSRP